MGRSNDPEKYAVYVGDPDSNVPRRVLAVPSNAMYIRSGYLLFAHDQTLMAQHLDREETDSL